MGIDVTTAAYHNSYDIAKKETKRAGDRDSARTDNLQDLRDVLAVGKSVERSDLEKMMKKYDPDAYAEYSKLVQESQNTISFMSQWRTKMKKALQDGTIVSGRPKSSVRSVKGNVNVSISKEARELFDGRVVKKPKPSHEAPKAGQLPRWKEISRDLAENGFYKNMTRQEIDYLEGFLRNMRSAKDLNIFADKHTSGDLREFLKNLAQGYANADRGHLR